MAQYAIPYTDTRERKHVVAVEANTPEEALEKVIAFQTQNGPEFSGWYYNGFDITPPDIEDVVEIQVSIEDSVQILWHQDYD